MPKASMRKSTPTGGTPLPLDLFFANKDGQLGVAYSCSLIPTGGRTPYTLFSIVSGSLPTGLSLNTATGEISGTPTAAGAYSFTARVTDTATTTADFACKITVVQTDGTAIVASITSLSATDDLTDRWQELTANHAVVTVSISCSSYPQDVTIEFTSPEYGRKNHGVFRLAGPTTIYIGKQGSNTIWFPPVTTSSETVTVRAAPGKYDELILLSGVTGVQVTTVVVAGPAVPNNNDATGFYITTAAPTYGPGPDGAVRRKFGWRIQGYLPITSTSNEDRFWSMRMCIETGKYVGGVWTRGGQRPNAMDPTDKRTVVGDYTGPTAWYDKEDHDIGIKGDPSTGLIIWDNPNLWDVPNDGFPIFRHSIWIQSRRNGGTWVQEATWSSGPGVSTPGTNFYQELVIDDSQTALTQIAVTTSGGHTFKVDSTTTGAEIDGASGYKTVIPGGSITLQNPTGTLNATPQLISSSDQLDIQAYTLEVNGNFDVNSSGIVTKVASASTDPTSFGVPGIVASGLLTSQSTNQSIVLGSTAGVYEVGIAVGAAVTDGAHQADVTVSIAFNSLLDGWGSTSQAVTGVVVGAGTGAPAALTLACGVVSATGEAWPRIFFPPFIIYHRGGSNIQVVFSVSGTWTTARYSAIAYLKRLY